MRSPTINKVVYQGERIRLERHGKDRLDLDEARAALADAKRRGTIPWQKVKAALRK